MKKLVSEEGQTLNYNKWVKGIADREFNSQKFVVNDLFSKNKDQSVNTRSNQNILPYPLSNLVPSLGNALISLQNSISIIRSLGNNPLLKKESNSVHIEQSLNKLIEAAKNIQDAANSVDNIQSGL